MHPINSTVHSCCCVWCLRVGFWSDGWTIAVIPFCSGVFESFWALLCSLRRLRWRRLSCTVKIIIKVILLNNLEKKKLTSSTWIFDKFSWWQWVSSDTKKLKVAFFVKRMYACALHPLFRYLITLHLKNYKLMFIIVSQSDCFETTVEPTIHFNQQSYLNTFLSPHLCSLYWAGCTTPKTPGAQ